jgi:hypothetical protein
VLLVRRTHHLLLVDARQFGRAVAGHTSESRGTFLSLHWSLLALDTAPHFVGLYTRAGEIDERLALVVELRRSDLSEQLRIVASDATVCRDIALNDDPSQSVNRI